MVKKPKEGVVIDTAAPRPKDKKFDPNTELRSDMWGNMPLNDLWLQKILLQEKINFCNQIGNGNMKIQLERAMAFLQALIEEKQSVSDTHLIL